MRAGGPRSQGSFHARIQPGPGARRERGPLARMPRRQARLPGDAGRRPALPGILPREHSTRAPVLAGSAGRWPACRAVRRGSPADAGRRPALPGLLPREHSTRAPVLAGSAGRWPACRAARRGSPGMRAGGPRSQGSFHASIRPGPRCSPGARAAGPHAAPPGAAPRGCGPAARAPRAPSTRAFDPGPGARRERGPLARMPRRQARLPADGGPAARAPRRQSSSRKDSSAMRAARKIARPLFMLSFHSRRAIESATTPPPACM